MRWGLRRTSAEAEPVDATTREAIVEAAREVYGRDGYTVPLHRVASAAGVSEAVVRRAFPGPADLPTAVYGATHLAIAQRMAARLTSPDPVVLMGVGIDAWLDEHADPAVLRLLGAEACAVLGWETWRRERTDFGRLLIDTALADAMDKGVVPEQPVRPLGFVVEGALESAILYASLEPDPAAALERARTALRTLLGALVSGG